MAKKIGEYGETSKPQMRPTCGIYQYLPAVALFSATPPLGQRTQFFTDGTNVLLVVVNDLAG
jgi:hypothetical protein